jgi:hypothetical protein
LRREGLDPERQDWLEELAAEPDAEDWVIRAAYPEGKIEFYPEPWHGLYWGAWDELRYDRQYLSSMGGYAGETPLSYMAVRAYAEDHGITGPDLQLFKAFMSIIDDEWLKHVRDKEKGGTT